MTAMVVSDELKSALDRDGYVVVQDVLDPGELIDPVLDVLAYRLAERSRQLGRRSFARLDLTSQLIALIQNGQDWVQSAFDVALPPGGPYAADLPLLLEPEVFALLASTALLDVIERIIGPEIWLNPSGHTRTKVPQHMAGALNPRMGHTSWHQDAGVTLPEADDFDILSVWIPLTDAPVECGPLAVHPTPVDGALLQHCVGATKMTSIPDALLPTSSPTPVPMRRGSILMMRPKTPHQSLPNVTSDRVRISLDMRFQPVETPNGRPWQPSFLLRSSDRNGGAVATFSTWRDGWLRCQQELVATTHGNKLRSTRWAPDADGCA